MLIIATSYLAINQSGSIRGDAPAPSVDTQQPLRSQIGQTQATPSRIPRPQKVRKMLLAQISPAPDPSPSPSQQEVSKILFAQVSPAPTPTPNAPAEADQTPNAGRTQVTEPGEPPPSTGNSYLLDNFPLNDLYQYLASEANLQYFHSQALDSIRVTGQLFKGVDPLENMRELALQYNLVLYQRGSTIYAKTQEQIVELPQQEFRYELKYLRPAQEEVHQMLDHFLTSDRASVTFEPKVNTIVVMDNESAIRRISAFLSSVDRPKRQISIQVRVVSINNTASKGTGVDWSNTLGPNGLALSATAQSSINSLFGFDIIRQALSAGQSLAAPFTAASQGSTSSSSTSGSLAGNFGNPTATTVTLGPVQVNAILRALYGNDRVTIENAPLVVTEDNEPANLSVVTRTPIVTSTVTITNGIQTTTNEVRYQLDAKDKTDPAWERREIGTQLAVTPTMLPDGTIRLLINGTVATQTSSLTVPVSTTTSNVYPIVNESHISNLARLPAGYSLILGGFINESVTEERNKVPVLGNIPLLGYAFRGTNYVKQRSNLVFIITPTAYDANSPQQAVGVNEKNRQDYSARPEDNYADPNDPKHNADVYPKELRNALACPSEHEVDTNPISDRNPEVRRAIPVTTRAQQRQKHLEERYRQKGPIPQPTP
jgi:Flp pilus assembly secretin CpaC